MSNKYDNAILNAIFNPLLPIGESGPEEEVIEKDESGDSEHIKKLECEGVMKAEEGKLDDSLQIFTEIIKQAPQRASAYNNRAQVLRLKGITEDALEDLDKAITLSGGRGRAACQALCQRGLIFRKNNEDDKARSDFEAAAKLGSQFAKTQLVQMNPYAALCNEMLQNVFNNLYA